MRLAGSSQPDSLPSFFLTFSGCTSTSVAGQLFTASCCHMKRIIIKCTDQQKTVSVLLNMLEKGKFPCFWCSRILQRVSQLPRRAIIITWENYNSMGRNRRVQWTWNCQTAGWCFSQWLEVPSLIKLRIGFKEHHSTTQADVCFCQNLSRTSGRTFCSCQDAATAAQPFPFPCSPL